MPPAGVKPVIPAGERPQTRALDCAATGIGISSYSTVYLSTSQYKGTYYN
jgi:hypothetical protein